MENILIGKNTIISVPEVLCENKQIFQKVLSVKTWETQLTIEQRKHLIKFLPEFPEEDDKEKNESLRKLFSGENLKFGNQTNSFFKKMNEGLLSPPVARLGRSLKKSAYKEYCMQQKRYFCSLLQSLVLSRKLLLEAAQHSSPDAPVGRVTPDETQREYKDHLEERTRWRYFTELQEVREECAELGTSSEDENFPGPPPKLSRKHKKHLLFLESSLGPDMNRILPTTASVNKSLHVAVSPALAMLELTEERYRSMLQDHQQRRANGDLHPELNTSKLTLEGIMQRAAVSRRTSSKSENSKKKWKSYEEKKHKKPATSSSFNVRPASGVEAPVSFSPPPLVESLHESCGQVEPVAIGPTINLEPPCLPTTIQVSVANSFPVTTVSIDPPSDEMEVDVGSDVEGHLLSNSKTEISKEEEITVNPTSFFALLRDLFYELPEQKMSVARLEERVRCWMEGPLPVVCNDWLTQCDPWVDLVSSALKFLAGDLLGIQPDNFVPYLDYREKQQQWQWIGAGRDTDEHLNPLCQHWLDNKDDLALEALESCQGSPPPARVATDWTVKPACEEEKIIYRQQECIRYQNPHKAFTFRVHGYESVVGPVKGVYGKESGVNKAREHSLLISERPPFVTILSLVRDSAARLPNGEGTRADICELLKDSQYLSTASDQQIHTVVSGALDRLHYEKDPCVKYDTNRKLWIYLHRHRTEEEFEKIHQAQAAAAKAKKAMQKAKPQRTKPKDVRWNAAAIGAIMVEPSSQGEFNVQQHQHSPRSLATKITQPSKSGQAAIRRSSVGQQVAVPNLAGSPAGTSSTNLLSTTKEMPICTSPKVPQPKSFEDINSLTPVLSHLTTTQIMDATTNTTQTFVGQSPILQSVIGIGTTSVGTTQTVKSSGIKLQPSTLQGFQTIVINQEQVNKAVRASGTTLKPPVVARFVSSAQMMSLSSMVDVPALRFQGANYVRPNVSQASLNLLQTAQGVTSRLSKFALVSPSLGGNTTQLPINVRPAIGSQLNQQDKPSATLLTSTGTLKLVTSTSAIANVFSTLTTTSLTGKTLSQGALSTAGGTAMVTMTSGSIPSVLLPGSNPVMIASQTSLKPNTQSFMMATGAGSAAAFKALQGIKVIPVSQAVNALRGKGGQTPLLARIIAPAISVQPPISTTSSISSNSLGIMHHGINESTVQMVSPKSNLCQHSVIVQVHTPVVTTVHPIQSQDGEKKS